MKSVLQRTMRRRTVFLSLLLLFWAGGLSFRLVQMQIIHRAEARKKILLQNQKTSLIHPQRGTIYDRKGCILARSISRESVFYHPSEKVSVSRQIKKISRLKNRLGAFFVRSPENQEAHPKKRSFHLDPKENRG